MKNTKKDLSNEKYRKVRAMRTARLSPAPTALPTQPCPYSPAPIPAAPSRALPRQVDDEHRKKLLTLTLTLNLTLTVTVTLSLTLTLNLTLALTLTLTLTPPHSQPRALRHTTNPNPHQVDDEHRKKLVECKTTHLAVKDLD